MVKVFRSFARGNALHIFIAHFYEVTFPLGIFLFLLSLLLFFFPLIRLDRSNDASRVKLDNLLRVKKKGNK